MTLELYKSRTKGDSVIFVATKSDEHLEQISELLRSVGARSFGPRAWLLKEPNNAEKVRAVLSELGPEDCVYVVGGVGGELESSLIVRQRTTGGITARSGR